MLTDEAGKDLVDVCQDAAAKCFYDRYKIMKKVLVNEMQCPKFVMQSVSTFEKTRFLRLMVVTLSGAVLDAYFLRKKLAFCD